MPADTEPIPEPAGNNSSLDHGPATPGPAWSGLQARLPYALAASPQPPSMSSRRSLVRLLAILALAIVGFTTAAIAHTFMQRKQQGLANLQVIADLRARQIADWLAERQGDARLLRMDPALLGLSARPGDPRGLQGKEVRKRLEQFRTYNNFQSAMLLDREGKNPRNGGAAAAPIEPTLAEAARQAAATGEVAMLGPYRDGSDRLRLDFLVPLAAGMGPPRHVAILRADPAAYLSSPLQTWPAHNDGAETLVFRRDGEQVLYLNELRHQDATAAALRRSIKEEKLLAAQVLRGELEARDQVEGVDYRGIPVLGVVRSIPGTDWFLIAKEDRGELYAEAVKDSLWIALAGVLVIFVTAAGTYLFHQRQQLDAARREKEIQGEKLKALQLLDIIARESPDVIFVKDTESRYLFLNEGTARFIGKPVAEVLGRDETALLSPTDAAVIMAEDRRVMAENQLITYEDDLMTKVGLVTFLTTKGPIHDAEGRVIGIFGIARDITQRREAEEQVRKLSLAVEQSQATILITDLEGRIEYVNEAGLRITGYSREEVMGRRPSLFKSGRTSPEAYAALWQALDQGRTWEGEFCNRRKDGSEYYEQAIITPIRQADGSITHYVAVKEDISEKRRLAEELESHRHRLEQLVAERTEELQTVLDTIPAAVLVASDRECRHITCNPAGNRLFALDKGHNVSAGALPEAAGDYRIFDPAGRELAPHQLAMQRAAAEGRVVSHEEYRLVFADGREIWLYGHASPLFGQDGEARGAVGVFADISERKLWEQTLERRVAERTAELTAANKELEGFTYAASHDMKAPLGRLISLSTLLGRQYRLQLEGDGVTLIDLIQQNASRLNTLVEELLAHAQVGQQPLVLQAVPVEAAIQAVLLEQGEEIRRNGAAIRLDLPAGLAVRGDPLSFGQVLRNLVENALKYSAPAQPPRIEIGGRAEDGQCTLWVRDNGIGIAKAYQDRIFEIFRRLHTYNEYPGTGIGLALVKKAMERMGGRVWVDSEPGQGATFYLSLPAAATRTDETAAAQ